MLALLQFLQNLIGKRTLLVMVVLAAVSIIAIEFTNVARNFYETSNQKQIAEQAAAMQLALQQEKTALAIKAAEDAKRAAFDAKTAEAIARESALRQEAERREKQALADKADADRRTAEAVARESALRQEAERREKQALADKAASEKITAAATASNSEDMQRALADKTRAEATKTDAEAIKAQVMACVFDPSACTAAQKKVITGNNAGTRTYNLNQDAYDRLTGHQSIFDGLLRHNEQPAEPQAAPPRPIAAAPPPATAQSARTPPAFDCAKATLGVEYVICSSPQLLEAEAREEDAYHAARDALGDDEIRYQHEWYTTILGQSCGLPANGRPSPAKIRASQNCVAQAIAHRIHALETVTAQRQAE